MDTMPLHDAAARDAARRVVAIYRTQILPLSETFVRDQALALRRWRPVLMGERQQGGLPLSGLAVATRYAGPPTLPQRLVCAARRRLGWAAPGLAALARQEAPRLIHAHFGFDGVEAWPLAQALGVPLLVTLHGSDITTRMDWFAAGRAGRRWRAYPRRLAALAAQPRVSFVAVSQNIREAALQAGLPAARMFVHPIGIDTRQFTQTGRPIADRPPNILFLGRLVEKKGAGLLLSAFALVRQRLPTAQLLIAGDGPLRAVLEHQAASIPGVRFAGRFTREQAQTFLAQARVMCLPSITAASGDAEGLGLVILEAQASGVPVVTSARGGAQEGIVDGQTGFAFAEHDVPAMAQRLYEVLSDDALAARLSAAAPAFVARAHDLFRQTAALEDLYDRLVGFA
jgi:glycosyltransferase involved in cell wall biosynthesis